MECIGILNICDSNSNEVDYTVIEGDEDRQTEGFGATQTQTTFTPSVSGTYYVEVGVM